MTWTPAKQEWIDNTPEPEGDKDAELVNEQAAEKEQECWDDKHELAWQLGKALSNADWLGGDALIDRLHVIFKRDYAASEGLAEALKPYLRHRVEQKLEELKNEQ